MTEGNLSGKSKEVGRDEAPVDLLKSTKEDLMNQTIPQIKEDKEMTRTVTTLRKNTKYGYVLEAQFIQDKHDQGGITYSLRMIEIWDDGHITYPLHSYERFNNKADGNRRYLILRNYDGFELASKITFEPTKMDMR